MINLFNAKENKKTVQPSRSPGLLSDINRFVLNNPEIPTLIKFKTVAERHDYSQRIMQRLGIEVNTYGILNMHKIGVDAPTKCIYEELLKWNGDSSCWPNHIANVERVDNLLENIKIFLFGIKKYPFGFKKSFFGLKFVPLFNLTAIRFQDTPDPMAGDNARFLLYKCSGGYPVGVFSMYVRSSIHELKEKEQSQLFLMVGFNFYGSKNLSKINIVNKIWETIHNRVTGNTMNRLKQFCEWHFEKMKLDMEQ